MTGEAGRWVSHDQTVDLSGTPAQAARRPALRRRWPRRAKTAGRTFGAVVEAIPREDDDGPAFAGSGGVWDGTRSLLAHLEAQVERLTEELAEARTEMRGARYEAESLRVEAGRAQVLMALVEAERARSAEVKVERDRLARETADLRRPWLVRVTRAFLDCRAFGRRPS